MEWTSSHSDFSAELWPTSVLNYGLNLCLSLPLLEESLHCIRKQHIVIVVSVSPKVSAQPSDSTHVVGATLRSVSTVYIRSCSQINTFWGVAGIQQCWNKKQNNLPPNTTHPERAAGLQQNSSITSAKNFSFHFSNHWQALKSQAWLKHSSWTSCNLSYYNPHLQLLNPSFSVHISLC